MDFSPKNRVIFSFGFGLPSYQGDYLLYRSALVTNFSDGVPATRRETWILISLPAGQSRRYRRRNMRFHQRKTYR